MSTLDQVKDAVAGATVIGQPYEKNGVTVLPVASVRAGSVGRGDGGGPAGVDARPAGVFVIKGDDVRWMPAFDLNRVIFMGQLVGLVAILSWWSVAMFRARRR